MMYTVALSNTVAQVRQLTGNSSSCFAGRHAANLPMFTRGYVLHNLCKKCESNLHSLTDEHSDSGNPITLMWVEWD